jgi:hypothetical protein
MTKSKPEQTELGTRKLPAIPTVKEIKTWDEETVLRWIEQSDRNILKEGDLDNFKKASIAGRAFLASDVGFLHNICGLSPGASLGLKELIDEVKEEGKFNPWT